MSVAAKLRAKGLSPTSLPLGLSLELSDLDHRRHSSLRAGVLHDEVFEMSLSRSIGRRESGCQMGLLHCYQWSRWSQGCWWWWWLWWVALLLAAPLFGCMLSHATHLVARYPTCQGSHLGVAGLSVRYSGRDKRMDTSVTSSSLPRGGGPSPNEPLPNKPPPPPKTSPNRPRPHPPPHPAPRPPPQKWHPRLPGCAVLTPFPASSQRFFIASRPWLARSSRSLAAPFLMWSHSALNSDTMLTRVDGDGEIIIKAADCAWHARRHLTRAIRQGRCCCVSRRKRNPLPLHHVPKGYKIPIHIWIESQGL
jgi:hypothetical protein